MNTTHCKRRTQNRHPHRNNFLAALLIAVMVMLLTVPAFAVEEAASESVPDAEVSTSTPNLVEKSADEDGAFPNEAGDSETTSAPPAAPVTTIEDLLDAIAHANANDVIEFDAFIQTTSDLVLGRADCPITIRRATPEARLMLGPHRMGNIKVQNITFDGAGIQAVYPIVDSEYATQIFEKCNFVNCIAEGASALHVSSSDMALISDCHFADNTGYCGAHLYVEGRNTTIKNCTFTGGFASDTGSVYICTTEKSFLTGCTISGNTAGRRSGGIHIGGEGLSIVGCKVYGNTANGVADDITKDYWARLSLADDYAALVELYKPDGVIPNRWTVDSRFDAYRGTPPECADMVFSMTFVDNEPLPAPSPASITLDKSELALYVGETETLIATLQPERTSDSVQWTSSDPTVASVTERGLIAAHSAGTTLITATATVSGASASCLVNVQDVPAKIYSINIGASPMEGGMTSGGGQYEEGATATVTAVPYEDFRFLAWTETDVQISTESSLTFTVSNDLTLTAIFEPISEPVPGPILKPTYTINTSATVGGIVSGAGQYELGSSVTLTATPESGYLFMGWSENGKQVSADTSFTFIVDCDRTLVANFTPTLKPTYTIHVNSTEGGVVEGGGSHEEGEFITVNAVPDNNYRFLNWEENGEQVCTEARYSFTAATNRTLVAIFDLIPQSTSNPTHEPSHDPGTPSISHNPSSRNTQPVATSVVSQKEVQIPTLIIGKTILTAPDDLFWVGYKTGRDNGTGTVTRADLAQLVYSMMDNESRKIYGATRSPFHDVEPGAWCEAAVGAMLDTGIMVGCGNGRFCPDRTLTWGELLTVFARFAEDKSFAKYYTGEHWAKNAVNKAFALGWLEYSETFNPGSMVTTSEMADLIQAVFQWHNK